MRGASLRVEPTQKKGSQNLDPGDVIWVLDEITPVASVSPREVWVHESTKSPYA